MERYIAIDLDVLFGMFVDKKQAFAFKSHLPDDVELVRWFTDPYTSQLCLVVRSEEFEEVVQGCQIPQAKGVDITAIQLEEIECNRETLDHLEKMIIAGCSFPEIKEIVVTTIEGG